MFGTDPEFFILDPDGKPVPAWKFFPPKRDAKLYNRNVFDLYYGRGSAFRDGYAVEVNTHDGSDCRALLTIDVRAVLSGILEDLPKGYSLTTAAAVPVDPREMLSAPPDCQEFGCDPALNAYTKRLTRPNIDSYGHPWRYAGGHMHFSGDFLWLKDDESKFQFIKLCDLLIGLPLAYLFDDEMNRQRRKFYGRAGECRFQTYADGARGIEYRVPSPQLWNHHALTQMFYGVLRSIALQFDDLSQQWSSILDAPLAQQINSCVVSPSWLQTVSGHYTPALLKNMKEQGTFAEFTLPAYRGDSHEGFFEWIEDSHRGADVKSLLALDGGYKTSSTILQVGA